MSDKNSLVTIVKDPPKPPRRTWLDPSQVAPHRAVEVVTEEEKRHTAQVEHHAELPKDFYKRIPIVQPPLVPGAEVNCETLLGFLAALQTILPPETNYPILGSAKIGYDPAAAKLYLEAGSHAVWTMIALQVVSGTDKGFSAIMPIQRAKNVLMALRDVAPTVVVGVDELGVCLGPHTVPFGGPIDDFPDQPVVIDWVARAAVPVTYFRDIADRVLVARSEDFKETAIQGALIDFEFMDYEGASMPLCTVVATDANRIHILRLPRMMIEVKQTHLRSLPPTCTVAAGFFSFLKEIAQPEWACLELARDQVVAKGPDFVVIAKAATEAKSSLNELVSWRKVNIDYPGYWLAAGVQIVDVVKRAGQGGRAIECKLVIDRGREALTVSSITEAGERFSASVPVRGFDGMPVEVRLSIMYLLEALGACTGGLVRLAFTADVDAQATSPVVIRGEDEQFKAIIMPRL
jgi:DNA polymerase III sliding clamp (beta) subunit (PCNA family)